MAWNGQSREASARQATSQDKCLLYLAKQNETKWA